jgi:O-antigen/teichoic acid export membrane protein
MTRSRLLQNTGTNMAGRLVAAGSNLVAAPIIIHAIGREGFGVVTFTLSFLAIFALLDLGLAATANRALAQASEMNRSLNERADLLRTFELIYWAGASAITVAAFAVSAWVARDWLRLSTLPSSDATLVVALTGLMVGIRFPVGLYSGVLFGLGHHSTQNAISGGFSVVRYLGGAALVVFVSPSVVTYSKWLALTGLVEVLVSAIAAWAAVGGQRSFLIGRFRGLVLARHWQFSLVFAATGAIGSLSASLDRIVLGKLLPAAKLGLYGLLYTPAGVLALVSAALGIAAFPEFAAATSVPKQHAGRDLFVRTQLLTVVCILVIAVPLAMHYAPILRIWTHESTIAHDGLVPGILLVVALAVNALAGPALTFIVASGRPRIALLWNVAALVIVLPSLLLLVPWLGLTGAGISVLVTNTLGLGFYFFQACRILELKEARAYLGWASLLAFSLCACNLSIALACRSDLLRVALGTLASGAVGYLLFKKSGLLRQFLGHPSEN